MWRHLFGEETTLGGLSIRDAKLRGKWRPGRRSVEVKINRVAMAHKKITPPVVAKVTPIAPPVVAKVTPIGPSTVVNKVAPVGTPPSVVAKVVPSPSPSTPPAMVVTKVSPAAPGVAPKVTVTSTPIATRPSSTPAPISTPKLAVRRVLSGLAGMLAGAFLDGLGDDQAPTDAAAATPNDPATDPSVSDVGYVPNARVWVSQAAIALRWNFWGAARRANYHDPDQARGKFNEGAYPDNRAAFVDDSPILFPDGTPLVSRIWLPKIDVGQLSPEYQSFLRKVANGVGMSKGAWNQDDVEGLPPGYILDPTTVGFPPSAAPQIVKSHHSFYDAANITTRKWDEWDVANSFDWSQFAPTQQAYPWLYDEISENYIGWLDQPADLWRSDGLSFSSGGTLFLPGPPWPFLALDFMDALATGAHGMPAVIGADGVLDQKALQAWCAANPPWDRLLSVWNQGGPFVLATVYDSMPAQIPAMKAGGGVAVSSTPDAPAPAPDGGTTLGPDGQPIDPSMVASSDGSLLPSEPSPFNTPSDSGYISQQDAAAMFPDAYPSYAPAPSSPSYGPAPSYSPPSYGPSYAPALSYGPSIDVAADDSVDSVDDGGDVVAVDVFTDDAGNYYYLDESGNPVPIDPAELLDDGGDSSSLSVIDDESDASESDAERFAASYGEDEA